MLQEDEEGVEAELDLLLKEEELLPSIPSGLSLSHFSPRISVPDSPG